MTPAEIAELTDPEEIHGRICGLENLLYRPLERKRRKEAIQQLVSLEERYLEVVGEPWRP